MQFSASSTLLTIPLALAGLLIVSAALSAQTTTEKSARQKPTATIVTSKKAAPRKPSATKAAEDTKAAPAAAAPGKETPDRFTAIAANLGPTTGEMIVVDLIRWSTDAERDNIVSTLKDKGDKNLATALQQAPNIGYIWRSGSGFGAFVRYAYRFKARDGEHVVLATDSDLSSWRAPAKPGSTPAGPAYNIFELVMRTAGSSAGTISLGAKVVSDAENRTIRLENFASLPVTLKGVKHVRATS